MVSRWRELMLGSFCSYWSPTWYSLSTPSPAKLLPETPTQSKSLHCFRSAPNACVPGTYFFRAHGRNE